jgi:hypothetical protein
MSETWIDERFCTYCGDVRPFTVQAAPEGEYAFCDECDYLENIWVDDEILLEED